MPLLFRVLRLPLVLLVVFAASAPAHGQTGRDDVVEHERDELTIETAAGQTYPFEVELAVSREQQVRGLMWRASMPMDTGMLFLFPEAAMRSFWMRNTLIPLDMLFLDADGRIVNIVESAEPRTETPRRSTGPAVAVLELNGGVTRLLGIRAGDRVLYEAFGTAP